MKKTVEGEYQGLKLKVINTWLGGATLFHNEKIIGTSRKIFALDKSKPLMTAAVLGKAVEVFAYAPLFKVLLQIKVDGNKIAGDEF